MQVEKVMKAIVKALDKYDLRPLVRSYGQAPAEFEEMARRYYAPTYLIEFTNGYSMTIRKGFSVKITPQGEKVMIGPLLFEEIVEEVRAIAKL